MSTYTYSASSSDKSSFFDERPAKSLNAAVRLARKELHTDCSAEGGTLCIYENGTCIRMDENSIFTDFKWNVRSVAKGNL